MQMTAIAPLSRPASLERLLQMTLTADLSRSEQAMARASGLASQRCVFVQDASQHLPRVKTADLASGTLFGSSEGTDDRYDFER
jgi:hypothetical protein